MTDINWVKLIGGGFAGMTAPFAQHPSDKKRAREYMKQAEAADLTLRDALQHARSHLEKATGWPTGIDVQLGRVRKFYSGKLAD